MRAVRRTPVRPSSSDRRGVLGAGLALVALCVLFLTLGGKGRAAKERLSSLEAGAGAAARSALGRIERGVEGLQRRSRAGASMLTDQLLRRELGEQQHSGAPAFISAAAGTRTITATSDRPPQRRASTLVIYVYNPADEEQRANFAFFMRWGIKADDGVTYRIVLTRGKGMLVSIGASQVAQPLGVVHCCLPAPSADCKFTNARVNDAS